MSYWKEFHASQWRSLEGEMILVSWCLKGCWQRLCCNLCVFVLCEGPRLEREWYGLVPWMETLQYFLCFAPLLNDDDAEEKFGEGELSWIIWMRFLGYYKVEISISSVMTHVSLSNHIFANKEYCIHRVPFIALLPTFVLWLPKTKKFSVCNWSF